ncbi:MAG TPA: DUF2243 domain-containing protein [Labilithrix sp.]|nr:DUF2243 domain-containing protein [Labilithrix sp.]
MIDHQILGIHHVHPGVGELGWDIGFLALGLVQMLAASVVVHGDSRSRRGRRASGSLHRTVTAEARPLETAGG